MEKVVKNEKINCYLDLVSDEEIKDFLKRQGYSIDNQIYYKTDGARHPIERNFDSKTHKTIITVCCKKDEDILTHKILLRKLTPLLDKYDSDFTTRMIIIKDYHIYELYPNANNEPLQKAFIDFMYGKFGERYRLNYNRFVTKFNKQTTDEGRE